MSKIAAIGRVVVVTFLAIVIVVAAVATYAYTNTSQTTTAETTSSSEFTTTYNATTSTTPFIDNVTNQSRYNSTTQTSTSNQTSSTYQTSTASDTTFTTNFFYWITINYSGSWNLVYWGWSGTLNRSYSCAGSIQNFCLMPYNSTQDNVYGNLNGSGDYSHLVGTYGIGVVENNFCANGTKLDSSQNNLTLTLSVVNTNSNTTASDPTAVACATYGV